MRKIILDNIILQVALKALSEDGESAQLIADEQGRPVVRCVPLPGLQPEHFEEAVKIIREQREQLEKALNEPKSNRAERRRAKKAK